MTIRKTLLLAFVLVGAVPALVLALLAFESSSRALQVEIERGLALQGEALLSDVRRLVDERLLDAGTWRTLEVMQDIQVGDVDKRLSAFLHRLWQGHGGLYRELSVADRAGRRVASSDAARIGTAAEGGQPWHTVTAAQAPVTLELPSRWPGEPGIGVTLRTPVGSGFAAGTLGELRLRLDWEQIDALLERSAVEGRRIALLDGQGRLLAGSAALLSTWPRAGGELAAWVERQQTAGTLFVGVSRPEGSGGSPAAALGLRVWVLAEPQIALAPVRTMAWIFAVLLAMVGMGIVVTSGVVSQLVARPIAALTRFSSQYRLGQPLQPPAASGGGEIGELHRAFAQMVADIERSQQQLARASALAAVGEMSSVIAHEVRTPLGIMLSSAQILQREAGLSAEGRELASYIESETARLGRLVTAMLDSTRPRPPQPLPTDIGELLAHAAGLLGAQAAQQGVSVHTQVVPLPGREVIEFPCDAEQMTQVLLNLLQNGLQILGRGGRIEISAREEPARLAIAIADDGPGIAPEARQRIFEAFYFQREGGIGLGLAVVQKIVAAHGGTVEAGASELGGALFRILLPRPAPNHDPT